MDETWTGHPVPSGPASLGARPRGRHDFSVRTTKSNPSRARSRRNATYAACWRQSRCQIRSPRPTLGQGKLLHRKRPIAVAYGHPYICQSKIPRRLSGRGSSLLRQSGRARVRFRSSSGRRSNPHQAGDSRRKFPARRSRAQGKTSSPRPRCNGAKRVATVSALLTVGFSHARYPSGKDT